MKSILLTTLKILAVGLVFFVGEMVGSVLALALGIPAPRMPEGSDAGTLAGYLLLASLGMGVLLAFFARRMDGSLRSRWGLLVLFGWVIYSLSNWMEAGIYTTFDSNSPAKLVMDLVAFAAAAVLAARLFEPRSGRHAPEQHYTERGWLWRLGLAWISFPIIYPAFGKLVEPLVIEVYRQNMLEMTAPTWGQIIPMQMLRSALLLVVLLPVVRRWNRSPRALWLSLAAGFFLLTGGFYMFQAYWMPGGFRLAHSLEMLADAVTYSAVVVILFAGRLPAHRRAAAENSAAEAA